MYSHSPERDRVDVVDLDPYGTAAPFIDAAVQCITDGGILSLSSISRIRFHLGRPRSLVCDMYGPLRLSHQQLSREMVGFTLLVFLIIFSPPIATPTMAVLRLRLNTLMKW
jgi:hypothetical protein